MALVPFLVNFFLFHHVFIARLLVSSTDNQSLLYPLGITEFTNRHDISFIFRRGERNATSTRSVPSLYEIGSEKRS
jgi:hypothetical protein